MNSPHRILLLDIETTPSLAYIWSCFQEGIPFKMVKDEGAILMWAAKWLDEREVKHMTKREGEKKCLKGLWDLMDESDVVIAHNGDNFDIKTMNGYFIKNGFAPPSSFRSVDTLKIARSRFKFLSNKLDSLGETLGLGRKVSHSGFKLWAGCMAGNKNDWATMIRYNIQDVKLLEKVYKKFLPWIKNHPNMGTFLDPNTPVCRNCGSKRVHKKGMEFTNGGIYQRYKCSSCGAPLRGKMNQLKRNPNVLT